MDDEVPILDEENYSTWRIEMRLNLKIMGATIWNEAIGGLAISVNRKQTSVYLSLMASTVVVAVMKIALNNSAVIIERRRDSDRWIPS
jgi:hypothetical protein